MMLSFAFVSDNFHKSSTLQICMKHYIFKEVHRILFISIIEYKMDLENLSLDSNVKRINKIKQHLFCRDPRYKIEAAEEILKNINYSINPNEFIQSLINADIIELLCTASGTTDLTLLQLIFECILKFTDNQKFYEQRHATFTFEYIVRTLHVLLKLNVGEETFNDGLELISILISRIRHLSVYLNEVCSISNILNLLKKTFENSLLPHVIFTATKVIILILESNISQPPDRLFGVVASQAIDSLMSMEQKASKTFVGITAELITNSMRCFIHQDENTKLDDSYKDLFMKIYVVGKEVLVPALFELNIYRNDLKLLKTLLTGLLSIYYYSNTNVKIEYSELLVAKGILSFFPELEFGTRGKEEAELMKSIILELLICLSQCVLGQEEWRTLLACGLHLDLSCNKIYLRGNDIIIPLASIVYNYFYLITFICPTVEFAFRNNLCRYILLLREKPSYPILKALWMLFSVAYLYSDDGCAQSKDAMLKMTQFLISSDLKSIYTHHPAVLYWSFSDSMIPRELQISVVILWIVHSDDQNTTEILSLMETNTESALSIMEAMPLCEARISFVIQNTIITFIEKQEDMRRNDVYESAWTLLATCLAEYSSNPEGFDYESIAHLIKICSDFIPQNIDLSLILKISYFFPGAFYKYFEMKYRNRSKETLVLSEEEMNTAIVSLNLAGCILNVGDQIHDTTVSVSLLSHEKFLTSVQFFLAASDENVIIAVMNLLTKLIKYQKKINYRNVEVVEIEGMKLLKLLQGGANVCIAVLEFLACYLEILSEKSVSTIIKIPQPTDLQLRALYLHIHMICSKLNDESITRFCWCCLKRLLELSEIMGLQEHLAMLPYTPGLLIKTSNKNSLGREAAKFISVWLKFLPTFSRRSHSVPKYLKPVQHLVKEIDIIQYGKDFLDTLTKAALLERPETPEEIEDKIYKNK